MTEQEKINQLIDSEDKANNYLALRLMLDHLQLSFKDAFSKLKFSLENPDCCFLEIAEIKILYTVDFHRVIDVPSDWVYVRRYIYLKEIELKEYFEETYVEETYLENFITDIREEVVEIQNDIVNLAPIIEPLFNRL